MNVKKLLENIERFPLATPENGDVDMPNVIAAVYGKALGFEAYDAGVREVCENVPGVTVRTVFDFEHSSDEDCFVLVICHENRPFALVHKFGDRSDMQFSVVDGFRFKELGKTLAQMLAELRLQSQLEELEREVGDGLDSLSQLKNGYLTWLSEDLGAFSFDHPSSTYGKAFAEVSDSYMGVAQSEDGTLHEVAKIVAFMGGWASEEADHVRIVTEKNALVPVDGRRIVFFLVPPEDSIAEARKCVATKTAWSVTGVLTRCVVRITQYQEGMLGAASRTYVVHNAAVMQDFLKKHGNALHEGVFCPSGRGFDRL
jgi:hypothetical protein